MTTQRDVQELIGRTAIGADGDKIGKIGQIYLDDRTGQPRWVTVSTGLFGTKESFAPLQGSRVIGDDVQLAVSKELVKDAPSVDPDGHLDDSENESLFAHYAGQFASSSDYADGANGDAANGSDETLEGRGHDVSGPDTDDAMTRSEEQLHVGVEQVESGRARLRKYVVTEDVTQTVPVSHEEVRVEREPITDANRADAMSGAEISEEEHEVTLHAEQPVVSKQAVPVERVRLGTETVTDEQTIDEEVRKEQIDTPATDEASGR